MCKRSRSETLSRRRQSTRGAWGVRASSRASAPTWERWLKEDPRVASGIVLERRREKGGDAKKSAVYDFVRKLRPPEAEGVARFEGVAGEFTQHDFGQFGVYYTDTGEKEVVHFFASRLKYSRLSHIVLFPDEKLETLCFTLGSLWLLRRTRSDSSSWISARAAEWFFTELRHRRPDTWREDVHSNVNQRANLAHCFCCGRSYNPIDLVIATRGSIFLDAVR